MNPSTIDIVLLLEQAQKRVSRDFDRALADVGATGEQWRVLDKLADEGGRPIGELAQMMGMHPPTMTKLVDRMVATGLVQRIVDEADSRRVLIYITDVGLHLFAKLAEKAAAFQQNLSSRLGASEASQLTQLLGSLAAD